MADIQVEGLDQLQRRFARLPKEVQRTCFNAMQAGAMDIIADAKNNLRSNTSVVTGLLRASGKVQKVNDSTLDAGFFSSENKGNGYAWFVEYGRKAGKFPPVDEIAQWVYKKFHLKDRKEAASIGFMIARKIAREGTKPHPFFSPAIERGWSKMMAKIQSIINVSL